MDPGLRRTIVNTLKLNGLSASTDGYAYFGEILKDFSTDQQVAWLDKILNKIQRQKLTQTLLRRSIIELAVKECGKGDSYTRADILKVVSAFDIPRLEYDEERKKFEAVEVKTKLLCNAPDKASVFKGRYLSILQRTLHNELFCPSLHGMQEYSAGKARFKLSTVEYLAGTSSKLRGIIVLGMITELKEGKYYIEDPTGAIQLDLTDATFQSGLIAENCFVLVEGHYADRLFNVTAVGLPPPEEAKATRAFYGSVNFFGGPKGGLNKERLEIIEKQNEDATMIMVADIFLDKPNVLHKLRVLFQGYSEVRPYQFILMGNFLSAPNGAQSAIDLRNGMKQLVDIILEFPTLVESSQFVFVPGPDDPGFSSILPRPPFANVITEYVTRHLPDAVFASNPCRIKYCTKEIVIFREDVLTKLCRNTLHFPEGENIPDHFVKTLISQTHLIPLPMQVCSVYWPFDHSMSIYPLPDLVITADRASPFTITRNGCIFGNPGSFSRNNFVFKVYIPPENQLQDCQLPAEQETMEVERLLVPIL